MKQNLYDIIDNPLYFGVINSRRHYNLCNECGYIPQSSLDQNTKFLDAHCKCGSPVQDVHFTLDEIEEIKYNESLSYMEC